MNKTEQLLECLTTEKSVSNEEAKELLRHYYYAMKQVMEEMQLKRDEEFERWAITQE